MPIIACDSKNEKVVPGRSTAFALPLPLRPEEEVYCIVLSCTCCHRDAIAKEAASVIMVRPVDEAMRKRDGRDYCFYRNRAGKIFHTGKREREAICS